MLRRCGLGNHLFDDGVSMDSIKNIIDYLSSRDIVACNECWEKFTKNLEKDIKTD